MTFYVQFECDNAAFEDNAHGEIARILREIAKKVEIGQTEGACMDFNGNRCGEFDLNS
jgi:hypothetical protein